MKAIIPNFLWLLAGIILIGISLFITSQDAIAIGDIGGSTCDPNLVEIKTKVILQHEGIGTSFSPFRIEVKNIELLEAKDLGKKSKWSTSKTPLSVLDLITGYDYELTTWLYKGEWKEEEVITRGSVDIFDEQTHLQEKTIVNQFLVNDRNCDGKADPVDLYMHTEVTANGLIVSQEKYVTDQLLEVVPQ